ncbi:MAG: hypothetical protein FJW90_09360 [Actinobacteria bacterium]|nr:hypothetical protein [Actinomycetota bacterium]
MCGPSGQCGFDSHPRHDPEPYSSRRLTASTLSSSDCSLSRRSSSLSTV